ncbi:hypothetical protein AND_001077 [Anopheles darlingi]|uniref:Zinc finger protein n=1 Tax=Anopheles darlingi TaxID=43151 RepID=W5JVN9_ANODA|nr:hypothetical protein AND_001077 [Anopheles darlingi]
MPQELCRICLTDCEVKYSLLEPVEPQGSSLYSVLCMLFPAAFIEDGNGRWPEKVCPECRRKIIDANELYELCAASGERFKRIFLEKQSHISYSDSPPQDTVYAPFVEGSPSPSEIILEEVIETDEMVTSREYAGLDRITETQKESIISTDTCSSAAYSSDPAIGEGNHNEESSQASEGHGCDKCNRVFSNQKKYETHVQCHASGRTNFCTICEKGYRDVRVLKQHMQSHSARFLCSLCGKIFNDKSNLKQHSKRHSGEKKFACSLCPIRFHAKGDLQAHQSTHSGDKQFSCEICGSKFTRKCSLLNHQRIHKGKRAYSCDACSASFFTAHHLKRHIFTHTGEKPYHCRFCTQKFAQSNDLVKHAQIHVGELIYQCDRCDAAYRLMSQLRNHYQEHAGLNGELDFPANKDFRFSSKDILNARYVKNQMVASKGVEDVDTIADCPGISAISLPGSTRKVACSIYEPARGEETFLTLLSRILHPHELPDDGNEEWPTKICEECKRKTLHAYDLYELCLSSGERIREMLSTTRDASMICKRSPSPEVEAVDCKSSVDPELLQFAPDEQQDLQEDLKPMAYKEEPSNASTEDVEETPSHLQSDCYSCTLCMVIFPSQSQLSSHLKDQHGDQCYYCEPCERAFLEREKYVAHKKCHDLGRIHFCTSCEKGFRTVEAHRLHVLSHDAPYLCAECGKKFETKSNLKQHMKRHSNVRAFACKLCPSKFHSKGELKTHQYTHSKLKQFSCDLCGALFTKNSSLAKHQRIHTGIRPFSCEACSRSFYTSDLLKRHMLTHTGERPYKCTYCIRSFSQSNDLVKHMRIHIGTNIYKCDRCDASYRLLSELRDHYKVHYQSDEGKGGASAESTVGEGESRDFRFTTTNILHLHYTKEVSKGAIKK